MPDTTTPEQWIDLLVRKAASLREAGVLDVEIGGCKATLAPIMPEMPEGWDTQQPADGDGEYQADPLRAGMTYGGEVPNIMAHRDPDE